MTTKTVNGTKMVTRLLGFAMCLALLLGMVFAAPNNTAHAEGATTGGLTIGGTTSSSGTGYSYDGKTQTLTLNGYNGKEIKFSGETIKVEGNNTITVDKTSNPVLSRVILIMSVFILNMKPLSRVVVLWQSTLIKPI